MKEGGAMVAAVGRHARAVQVGIQQGSAPHDAGAAGSIQSGELGPVRLVRIWNYTNMFPNGIGRAPDSDPPEGVDWDVYPGPPPKVPSTKTRFVNTYSWLCDCGGGLVTDFGLHRFDSMHQSIAAADSISMRDSE